MKRLPPDEVRYNGGIRCDMATGPCACGAWHGPSAVFVRCWMCKSDVVEQDFSVLCRKHLIEACEAFYEDLQACRRHRDLQSKIILKLTGKK